MSVRHGRHELPGWRGYLAESLDRSGQGPQPLGVAPSRPGATRRAAFGALALCALTGGAVVSYTGSAGAPNSSPVPAEDAGPVLARSSAWVREATPVLAAIELELRRTNEVRQRWETSSVARRGGPLPGAVVALLARQADLAHHREALTAAMTALLRTPTSELAVASAWQQLGAAQMTLRALVPDQGALFQDPLEAMVLRLSSTRGAGITAVGNRSSGRDRRPAHQSRAGGDGRPGALAAPISAATRPPVGIASVAGHAAKTVSAAVAADAPAAHATGAVSSEAVRPLPLKAAADTGPESSIQDTLDLSSGPGGVDTSSSDQGRPSRDGQMPQGSPSTVLTLTTASGLGSVNPSPVAQDPPGGPDTVPAAGMPPPTPTPSPARPAGRPRSPT